MKYKQTIVISVIVLVCITGIIFHMMYFYRNPSLPNWWIKHLESSQNLIELQIVTESITRDHLYFRLINNTDCLYAHGRGHEFLFRDGNRWRSVTNSWFTFDVRILLHPNTYSEFDKYLSFYGYLPDGEYAIMKEVIHDTDGTRLNVVGRFILRGE